MLACQAMTQPSTTAAIVLDVEARELVEDLKPSAIKNRSALGIVEATLDHGQSVKAVGAGVVYGLRALIERRGLSSHAVSRPVRSARQS